MPKSDDASPWSPFFFWKETQTVAEEQGGRTKEKKDRGQCSIEIKAGQKKKRNNGFGKKVS
jgi:hypothetical protein